MNSKRRITNYAMNTKPWARSNEVSGDGFAIFVRYDNFQISRGSAIAAVTWLYFFQKPGFRTNKLHEETS